MLIKLLKTFIYHAPTVIVTKWQLKNRSKSWTIPDIIKSISMHKFYSRKRYQTQLYSTLKSFYEGIPFSKLIQIST